MQNGQGCFILLEKETKSGGLTLFHFKRREESLLSCQQWEESLLYNLKRQSDSPASGNEKGIFS